MERSLFPCSLRVLLRSSLVGAIRNTVKLMSRMALWQAPQRLSAHQVYIHVSRAQRVHR